MEQIRIIREMREHDRTNGRTGEFIRPRYMVWENVVGAFSSNKGRDFAAVLEEAIRIAEPKAPDIDVPEKGWPTWGGYHDEVGGRWSVAWRVHDAQYWGVPQRRRRISLVADFGGDTAGEILFERKSVSRHPAASGEEGERLSASAERGARESGAGIGQKSVFCLQGNGIDRADTAGCNGKGWREDVSYTLNTIDRPAVCAASILDMTHANDVIRGCGDIVPTLQARMGTGGNQVPLTYGIGNGQANEAAHMVEERAQTLNTMHDTQACLTQYGIIRRLTPLECERLQGFPDGWTDIGAWTDTKGQVHKESSDSARYKALGNSIALPPWKWVLKRICAQYERNATLGSLFDGIGGFPLLWTQLNGWNSVKWASEIEPFCIAVTKRHFGDEAITMIERLTAENADLRKEIEWKDMVIALAQREQAKAEAERDALLPYAKEYGCETCKNEKACFVQTREGVTVSCVKCPVPDTCPCSQCKDCGNWEWRGLPEVKEEGEKA